MAKNLQAKLLPTDSLSLYDINREAMQRLAGEMETTSTEGASVALAASAADASQDAVCVPSLLSTLFFFFYMMRNIFSYTVYDLSWASLLVLDDYSTKANPLMSKYKSRHSSPRSYDPLAVLLICVFTIGRRHHRPS